MNITALDYLVLTVADVKKTIDFYTKVLGMQAIVFGDNRHALRFGQQKINLHQKGDEVLPNAQNAACGTADICLLTDTPLDGVLHEIRAHGIEPISEIVPRTGAMGKIQSIYLRDPDGNLIEISQY